MPLRPFPFGSSLSFGFGWFFMTTPQCIFSCLIHSRFPERFCHPVWQLRSLLPAFDPRLPGARRGKGLSPVHQGGRGCPARVLRGCCDTACAVSLTCMDMQLRKSSDFRRSASTLAGSFERTGRTHRVLRNSSLPACFLWKKSQAERGS